MKKATNSVAYGVDQFFNYFFGLPSPSMIQRTLKGVLSSNLKAYLASIDLMDPTSHWLTTLLDAPHKLPKSV